MQMSRTHSPPWLAGRGGGAPLSLRQKGVRGVFFSGAVDTYAYVLCAVVCNTCCPLDVHLSLTIAFSVTGWKANRRPCLIWRSTVSSYNKRKPRMQMKTRGQSAGLRAFRQGFDAITRSSRRQLCCEPTNSKISRRNLAVFPSSSSPWRSRPGDDVLRYEFFFFLLRFKDKTRRGEKYSGRKIIIWTFSARQIHKRVEIVFVGMKWIRTSTLNSSILNSESTQRESSSSLVQVLNDSTHLIPVW